MSEYTARIDITKYDFSFSILNKLSRILWFFVYWILFRPFNFQIFNQWRSFILRIFGAKLGKNTKIYASAKIWAPWNLEMGNHSVIGPGVDFYNQGKIRIGDQSIISQKSYLCASSHDFTQPNFPLILKPIEIGNEVWIAADAFIGPGVCIGNGAVVGARSSVFKEVKPWTVVGGNPAKFLKNRIISNNPE